MLEVIHRLTPFRGRVQCGASRAAASTWFVGQRAACRFCLGAMVSDDVTAPLDCDVFDDGTSNGSCP